MKLAAILLISFAVCGANAAQRPAWIGKVDTLFQTATNSHFDYNHYKHPTKNALPHLAHIVSWKDIDTIVDAWVNQKAKWDLTQFARYLFEVDTEAYVCDPMSPATCIKHTTILNNNNGALMKMNTDMKEEVLDEIDDLQPDISIIKQLLNSAPANLRYGLTPRNTNIQEWLDPMGDKTKELTTKEKSLIYVTDENCINYNDLSLITPPKMKAPFDGYADYFKDIIVKKVKDPYFLRGTHYDPSQYERTTQNKEFQPTDAQKKPKKLYVLSSSQAGDCPLGTLSGDQNKTPGDTIKYYVKNV